MNKKKWITGLVILGILAIAFFWGGDVQKSPISLEDSSSKAPVADEVASSQVTDITPRKEDEQAKPPVITDEHDSKLESEVKTEQQDSKDPADSKESEPEEKPKSDQSTESDKPSDAAQEKPATKEPLDTVDKNTEAPKSSTTTDKGSGSTSKVQDKDKPKSEPTKPEIKEPKPKPEKDKYLTDPVPEGKPKPVEWQDAVVNKDKQLTITLSVSSRTILDNMDKFNKDKLEVLPDDGVIYKAQKVTFYEGESVFDVLLREMKKNKIHMEFSMTPIYNSNYIEGINNLYEFDCGELSGWMYKVNGWFPNYGSSRYVLKDGDVVDWVYTCDLGRDVGGGTAAGGQK